jgi:hypothetical protein
MLIEIVIATAAAAGITSLLALRARRRRAAAEETQAAPAPSPPAPADDLPIALGAVVQHEGSSRWLRARVALSDDGRAVAALLIAREAGAELGVAVFAAPHRHILWLERVALPLPPSPPTRLEIDGHLFDRKSVMPLTATSEGKDAPTVAGSVLFAVYEGAESRAALVLQCDGDGFVYRGLRVAPDEWDLLGHVDPTSDELGTA